MHEGHATEVPKQLFDGKKAVPPPPKPGDIKVIVAGLPWQVNLLIVPGLNILMSRIASRTPL
jgi:hypothetical protein